MFLIINDGWFTKIFNFIFLSKNQSIRYNRIVEGINQVKQNNNHLIVMFLVYESDTLHRKIQTYDKKNELKTKN